MSDLCPVAVPQDSNALEEQPETANESHLLLLKQKKHCDVTFTFQNLPDQIQAHEFCLKARSPVFEQIFRMRKSGQVHGNEIEVTESTPKRFQEFLEFIYSDVFEVDISGALDLLQLAHKYKVHPLAKKCEQLLATEIKVEHSVKVFETACRYGRQDLMDRAAQLMVKSILNLLETDALVNAEEETVVFLLECDDLKVEEVKLFEFILKWGENQVGKSDDQQLLKDKLKNVISKIRYTNMTPYEFNKIVAPTGLLSTEETLSVYSYLLGNEGMRRDLTIKFNINRRKEENIEKNIDFYADQEPEYLIATALAKQTISFKAEQVQIVTNVWSDYHGKKAALMGIRAWWPELNKSCRAEGFKLNFRISVREFLGPVNEDNFVVRFDQNLMSCGENKIQEILLERPMEIRTGSTYSIIFEEQSASDLTSHRNGTLVYDGCAYLEITPKASVEMYGARINFKEICCSNELNGQKLTNKSPKINVIFGITVGLL